MNEPMIEIVLNGTNQAYQAGTISFNEAAALNQEAVQAAAVDLAPALKVTIIPDDIGDRDCRKLVWDIYAGNTFKGGFSSPEAAANHCREQGWEIVEEIF